MEQVIAKLRKEQEAIMGAVFSSPPDCYEAFLRRWSEWNGLGKAIAIVEQEGRSNDEVEE